MELLPGRDKGAMTGQEDARKVAQCPSLSPRRAVQTLLQHIHEAADIQRH